VTEKQGMKPRNHRADHRETEVAYILARDICQQKTMADLPYPVMKHLEIPFRITCGQVFKLMKVNLAGREEKIRQGRIQRVAVQIPMVMQGHDILIVRARDDARQMIPGPLRKESGVSEFFQTLPDGPFGIQVCRCREDQWGGFRRLAA